MLQVQIHIRMPKPGPGIVYSRALLDEIADVWLKGGKLPARIKVTSLEWRSGSTGRWKEETDPQRMKRVRADFRPMAQAGFSFTGVSAVGRN